MTKTQSCLSAVALLLSMAASANCQIVSGVMTVTGAEMHWWAGVACDATARLYDVDEDSVVFNKLQKTESYDQGTITFRARKGKLIDLDRLHESIWATRLSGGTRSGLISLEVTAIGKVVMDGDLMLLKVAGSDSAFSLAGHPDKERASVFSELRKSAGSVSREFRVTGRIDDYQGRWPDVLRKQPVKPRGILVSSVEIME